MGRAYAVREKKIKENGASKGKLYTSYAKEIFACCKKGGTDIEANSSLRRLIQKAKKDQIPQDIINRAIDKASGAGKDEYHEVIYEGFGPGSSTFIIKTLTDNVNRTVGEVRAAFNKMGKSLGVTNSVSYNYDNLSIFSFKGLSEDEVLNALIDAGVEPIDVEDNDGEITVTVKYQDGNAAKEAIEKVLKDVDYDIDESGWYPKETVRLEGEDLEHFKILCNLLDDIDDVTDYYHNVEL